MNTAEHKSYVQAVVRDYLTSFPLERPRLRTLVRFLDSGVQNVVSRKEMRGHVTASALVMDSSEQHVLMIRSRNLGRWLQPGGHVEASERLEVAAEREAREETGIQDLELVPWFRGLPSPIDIDTHWIPENVRKGEARHQHYD